MRGASVCDLSARAPAAVTFHHIRQAVGTLRGVNVTADTLPPLVDLTAGEEEVLRQTLQFEAALPGLLRTHAGRWIVWLDGLRSAHDTEEAARAWAADNLAPDSGRVVARVAERRPVAL